MTGFPRICAYEIVRLIITGSLIRGIGCTNDALVASKNLKLSLGVAVYEPQTLTIGQELLEQVYTRFLVSPSIPYIRNQRRATISVYAYPLIGWSKHGGWIYVGSYPLIDASFRLHVETIPVTEWAMSSIQRQVWRLTAHDGNNAKRTRSCQLSCTACPQEIV